MQVIDTFINVIKEEIELIGELVGLAEKKQNYINDAEQVGTISHQEQKLIDKLEKLEQERHQLLDIISPTKTMQEWLNETGDPIVNGLFQELQDKLSRLRLVNYTNQELIRESLNFVQFSLNLLIEDSPGTYAKEGQQSNHKSLFDRKV